jgi:hypothetical protein
MKKSVKSFAGWLLAAAVAITSISTKACADSGKPVLVFRLINSACVPIKVIEDAKRHVQRIYGESGIQIEWMESGEPSTASHERKHLTLTMTLVSESLATPMGQREAATGFAISNDGKGARVAYVFVERIERQADRVSDLRPINKPHAQGLILGLVIAHEAGHLMLPHGAHTLRGIMRATMDVVSVDQALRGNLLFSADQRRSIQTALINESQY